MKGGTRASTTKTQLNDRHKYCDTDCVAFFTFIALVRTSTSAQHQADLAVHIFPCRDVTVTSDDAVSFIGQRARQHGTLDCCQPSVKFSP